MMRHHVDIRQLHLCEEMPFQQKMKCIHSGHRMHAPTRRQLHPPDKRLAFGEEGAPIRGTECFDFPLLFAMLVGFD